MRENALSFLPATGNQRPGQRRGGSPVCSQMQESYLRIFSPSLDLLSPVYHTCGASASPATIRAASSRRSAMIAPRTQYAFGSPPGASNRQRTFVPSVNPRSSKRRRIPGAISSRATRAASPGRSAHNSFVKKKHLGVNVCRRGGRCEGRENGFLRENPFFLEKERVLSRSFLKKAA